MTTLQEKYCTKCFDKKAVTAFRNDKHSKDGKTSQCRDCLKQRDLKKYPEIRDDKLLSMKIARQEDPDKFHARDKRYDDARREEKHEYNVIYYATNLEKELARSAAYKAEHHEAGLAYQVQNRLAHLEERRAYGQRYSKEHPEVHRASHKRRRARILNAPINDLTHAQWLEIQAAQAHRCHFCGKRCKGKMTQDHIQPLSKGGSHTLHNVIAVCGPCNSSKGTKPPPVPVQPLLLTLSPAKPHTPRTQKG